MSDATSIYFVAGEASGDNHGAALLHSLGARAPALRFLGRGGPRMQEIAGAHFLNWSEQAGVVGLSEVLKRYGYFRAQFRQTLAEITSAKPDAVVLIDYPGFNLRLAKALRRSGVTSKIIYYISPQVWAWNRGRIPRMARWLDLMLCIFPFEAELYERSGLHAVFIGHPMIESLRASRTGAAREPDLIGLFPGSRTREVERLFPLMIEVARVLVGKKPRLRFEVAAASEPLAARIEQLLGYEPAMRPLFRVTTGDSTAVMQRAQLGIVASGTATLEAAFFRMPFVLVYKVSTFTYWAARMLIRVKHLGMPNVLANKEIVPEFVQHKANAPAVARALLQLLDDPARQGKMVAEFGSVIAQLGEGAASEQAAEAILHALTPGETSR